MLRSSVRIRPYDPADRRAVLALAPRLAEGVAAWRDREAVGLAVAGWVWDSLEQAGLGDGAVFVAEHAGDVIGMVSVSERTHFTGEIDGYIGELVVAREATRSGVGRALTDAAEEWSRRRGHRRITLETGAANTAARAFYAAIGFDEEVIRLSKPL